MNLGCGKKKLEGYINIDSMLTVKPDKVLNIEKGLPFRENSVEAVHADHVLEHMTDVFKVLEEIYRVCKNGAKVYIEVPYYKSMLAFTNPDHKHFFTEKTFEYYFDTAKAGNSFGQYVNYRFRMDSMRKIRERHRLKPWFMWPIESLQVVLTVIK